MAKQRAIGIGYRTGQMKTAEGMVEFSAPQVRETPEPFVSAIRENLVGRTQALEDLAVELYARGLSTRDIEDAFRDESGRRLLSRAAVSEITERLWAEYEAFSKRDLSEYRIVYLYVDGIAERLRAGQPREAVIAARGISEDGRKVLLHLMAGSKEDTETVRAFFQDMRARARRPPARGQRRSAWRHPRHRGVLPAFGAPALLGAPDAQPGSESPDRSVARIQGACGGLLSSTVHGRLHASSPMAFAPITPRRCHPRSPASTMTSKPASHIFGCPLRIAARRAQQICLNVSSSRSVGG
jgi:Transposase, Mutator family